MKKLIASCICVAWLAGCSTSDPVLKSINSGSGVYSETSADSNARRFYKEKFLLGYVFSDIESAIIKSLPVPPADKIRENFCRNSPSPSFASLDAQKLWSINHTWLLNAWAISHRGMRAGWRRGYNEFHYSNYITTGYNLDHVSHVKFCMDVDYSIKLWQETVGSSVTGQLTEEDVKKFQNIADRIDPRLVRFRSEMRSYGNTIKVINSHKTEDALVSCSLIPLSIIKQKNRGDMRSISSGGLLNIENSAIPSIENNKEANSISYSLGKWSEDNFIAYPKNCTHNGFVTLKFLESVGLPAGRYLTDEAVFLLKKMY